MFILFKDSSLGKIRISVESISSYRESNECVFLTLTSGQTFKTKDHTLQELDAAMNESYIYVKEIPRIL